VIVSRPLRAGCVRYDGQRRLGSLSIARKIWEIFLGQGVNRPAAWRRMTPGGVVCAAGAGADGPGARGAAAGTARDAGRRRACGGGRPRERWFDAAGDPDRGLAHPEAAGWVPGICDPRSVPARHVAGDGATESGEVTRIGAEALVAWEPAVSPGLASRTRREGRSPLRRARSAQRVRGLPGTGSQILAAGPRARPRAGKAAAGMPHLVDVTAQTS